MQGLDRRELIDSQVFYPLRVTKVLNDSSLFSLKLSHIDTELRELDYLISTIL